MTNSGNDEKTNYHQAGPNAQTQMHEAPRCKRLGGGMVRQLLISNQSKLIEQVGSCLTALQLLSLVLNNNRLTRA